jgi:ferritin
VLLQEQQRETTHFRNIIEEFSRAANRSTKILKATTSSTTITYTTNLGA